MPARSPDGEAAAGRDRTRQRVIDAAVDLMEREGRDAVTRAVAVAAGLRPPAVHRLFGDKEGLLEAVAECGFAAFLAGKKVDPDPQDPVQDLCDGWDPAVEFGVRDPALYALMYGEPTREASAAAKAGTEILMGRIRRLAAGGRLRVDENLAASIIHATARGAVLTWPSLPEPGRDPALSTALRDAMIGAVPHRQPVVPEPGPAAAARTLRAALPDRSSLTGAEQVLLREWLDRPASDG